MENDWILANIKKTMKEKGVKSATISKAIGISEGEFSKILNGQRIDYYDYLPKIANFFGISYHQLVKQDSNIIQNNHNQEGGTAIANSNGPDQVYVDKLFNQCDETIKSKDKTIKTLEDLYQTEKDAKDSLKRKYEKLKLRLQELEDQLKK